MCSDVQKKSLNASHNKTNESEISDLKSEHPAIFLQLFRFVFNLGKRRRGERNEVDERLALIQ